MPLRVYHFEPGQGWKTAALRFGSGAVVLILL